MDIKGSNNKYNNGNGIKINWKIRRLKKNKIRSLNRLMKIEMKWKVKMDW